MPPDSHNNPRFRSSPSSARSDARLRCRVMEKPGFVSAVQPSAAASKYSCGGCFCSGVLLPSHPDRIALKEPKLLRIRLKRLCRLETGWFFGWCVWGVGTGWRWCCPRRPQVRPISVPGLGAQGCSKPKVSQQRWQLVLCKPQLLRRLCVLLTAGCRAGWDVAELGRVPSSDG